MTSLKTYEVVGLLEFYSEADEQDLLKYEEKLLMWLDNPFHPSFNTHQIKDPAAQLGDYLLHVSYLNKNKCRLRFLVNHSLKIRVPVCMDATHDYSRKALRSTMRIGRDRLEAVAMGAKDRVVQDAVATCCNHVRSTAAATFRRAC